MHYLYGNSDWCQACIRCMEGVRISEGPLREVSEAVLFAILKAHATKLNKISENYRIKLKPTDSTCS